MSGYFDSQNIFSVIQLSESPETGWFNSTTSDDAEQNWLTIGNIVEGGVSEEYALYLGSEIVKEM